CCSMDSTGAGVYPTRLTATGRDPGPCSRRAGRDAGLFPDVAAAGTAMVQLEATIPPNPDHRAVYDRTFERYLALYPRLGDVPGL
ncbi:MAG: hypothetical protein ACRDJN_05455, partial [Chloroflexota bacterium]